MTPGAPWLDSGTRMATLAGPAGEVRAATGLSDGVSRSPGPPPLHAASSARPQQRYHGAVPNCRRPRTPRPQRPIGPPASRPSNGMS